MKNVIVLFLLVFPFVLFAQNKNITGSVIDLEGNIQPNTLISLLNASNNEILKTTFTDESGRYSFENLNVNSVILVVEQMGFEKFISEAITLSDKTIEYPIVLISTSVELEGVEITSQRPFVVQKIDRFVVYPDALISNEGTTALEALEKAPSVTVDMNGIISMKNKTGVQVFIDDKPSYLSASDLASYLRSIPSSSIESIEIIANPPAKYDASGNAGIINIRLKKNTTEGINAGINMSYGQGKYARSVNSLTFNYRIEKWNFFSNLSLNKIESYQDLTIRRDYFTPTGETDLRFVQKSYITPSSKTNSLRIGADYYASENTTLGIVLSGFYNPSNRNTSNNSTIQNEDFELINRVQAENPMDITFKNGAVNLNLMQKINKTQQLNVNVDNIEYNSKIHQKLFNTVINPDGTIAGNTQMDSNLPSDVKIKSVKADYEGIVIEGGAFSFGAKSSFVKTRNVADFFDVENNISTPNYQFSNDFTYKENIYSGYANYAKDWDKFSAQLGLRLEHSDIEGYQKGNPIVSDTLFTNKYTNFFPTLYVQYRADSLQNHVFGISLGRRIDRPNYKDLNPFTYPMDNFTFYGGNPFLKPTFSYNAELSYTFRRNITTTLSYSHIEDMISETNEQRDNIYYSRPGNFANHRAYGISVNGRFTITNWWTLQCYTALANNYFSSRVYTETLEDSQWNWVIMPTNQFVINDKWSAELSGNYQSSALSGQFFISPIGSVRAGVSKKILKDKGTLRLNFSDIFYTNQVEGEIRNIQNAKASWFSYMDSRVVTLSFSYRFSKGENLKVRQSGGAETEQGRVKA